MQALILCPTRELAIQVSEEFRKLLKYKDNIRVLPIYGGRLSTGDCRTEERHTGCHRYTRAREDHMRRRTIKAETVQMMVLDEADEMLDMGFREDIRNHSGENSGGASDTALLRNTFPRNSGYHKAVPEEPRIYQNRTQELSVPNIEQYYFDVKEKTKLDALCPHH